MNKSKLQVCFSIDAIARSPFYAILLTRFNATFDMEDTTFWIVFFGKGR